MKGGVGEAGDHYEQHADAVADLVVQGKSAESLLGPVGQQTGDRALQRKKPPMPGGAITPREGDIAPLERACKTDENHLNPDVCVLSDMDRIDKKYDIGKVLDQCADAFVGACELVRGTVAEKDSSFVGVLIGIMSIVASGTLSRAMGVVVGQVSERLKRSSALVHLMGKQRIGAAVDAELTKQIGTGLAEAQVLSREDGDAAEQQNYLDVFALNARAAFNEAGSGVELAKLDDRQLQGLYDSLLDSSKKLKVITKADYIPFVKAKLTAYKKDVQPIGKPASYPIRAVSIRSGRHVRLATCYRLHGRYLFRSWVTGGLELAAEARQRETQKHGLWGTPVEDTVQAKDVRAGDVTIPGWGMGRVLKSEGASFEAWVNDTLDSRIF